MTYGNFNKKIVCVIPARLESTRLPRKVLAQLHGKTLLNHVWAAACKCKRFSEIYVATDSEEIAQNVIEFGGKYQMTSYACKSGVERVIDFIKRSNVEADVWVNWQADEPFIQSEMIEDLLQKIDSDDSIWTLKKLINNLDIENKNIVKVVTDNKDRALYFSRSPIPYNRKNTPIKMYRHVGLYAYTTKALLLIDKIQFSQLAETESLEQLAFLEYGLPIYVYHTEHESLGIDTGEDLIKASNLMQEMFGNVLNDS